MWQAKARVPASGGALTATAAQETAWKRWAPRAVPRLCSAGTGKMSRGLDLGCGPSRGTFFLSYPGAKRGVRAGDVSSDDAFSISGQAKKKLAQYGRLDWRKQFFFWVNFHRV